MKKDSEVYENLQRFANDHKLILEDKGEVGFGRACVGFLRGDSYIAFNPRNHNNYELIWEDDPRLEAPDGVDAYHKHDCIAVLVSDAALIQLNDWVKHLESQGEVSIETYSTGATGLQAMISGVICYAVRVNP